MRLDELDVRSYGVSMSNLEDVFLKINQEFAPDLFGDLKNFNRNSKDIDNSERDSTIAKSIAHSSSGERSTLTRPTFV